MFWGAGGMVTLQPTGGRDRGSTRRRVRVDVLGEKGEKT